MAKKPVTYAEAGVDIDRAEKFVRFLKTANPAIGGFSGLVPLAGATKGMKKPTLVASTDGVGTKLLVAKLAGDLTGLGQDLVGMVVNDLLVCGARPLFFLDYYATSRLDLNEARTLARGILKGCALAECPLIGGETAELPGLYHDGDFDLAGFAVGVVDGAKVIDGSKVKTGDVVVGVESSGLHSNGYSLARRVLLDGPGAPGMDAKPKGLGTTVGKALLRPTKIYVAMTAAVAAAGVPVKAYAHITGGGIPGNLDRVLPKSVDAVIRRGTWPEPPVFDVIARTGPVDAPEMARTFNLGLGFMAVMSMKHAGDFINAAGKAGERAHVVGNIVAGAGKVLMEG